jgi:DNA repair exonuclease SbcCD nuclease subunit
MLKVLHTADWHVGRSFGQFEDEDARKLARDRLGVVDRILGLADQYDVHAVLCAGDLFDSPEPEPEWWRGLAESLGRRKTWTRPVVFLPGNHDPLTTDSVYSPSHPFRRALPEWVRIVDREDFQLELSHDAVVYAAPCRSTAGDKDLALSLPSRGDGDTRVRIGLVHGSTFDIEGHATNFPVSREAPQARGLDYLAIGDTHSFREIPEGAVAPIVYPSAPEPTSFKEHDAGYVALVLFTRHGRRPQIKRERVARWTWRDVAVRSMAELRALATEDLVSTVLRLKLDLMVSIPEMEEVEDILSSLRGTNAMSARTGAFVCDRSRLRLEATDDVNLDEELPEAVREAAARLNEEARTLPEDQRVLSQRAFLILRRLLHEVR